MLTIRGATESDSDAIWQIFREVVREGNAFLSDETMSRRDALQLFVSDGVISYVATVGANVVGAYNVKRNHPGRGSHVANATYMVAAEYRGRGIGSKLAEHSLQVAKEQGYRAMQFNAVVSTNSAAVALWHSLGFETVGTIPQGFADPNHGLVDVFIMHKQL